MQLHEPRLTPPNTWTTTFELHRLRTLPKEIMVRCTRFHDVTVQPLTPPQTQVPYRHTPPGRASRRAPAATPPPRPTALTPTPDWSFLWLQHRRHWPTWWLWPGISVRRPNQGGRPQTASTALPGTSPAPRRPADTRRRVGFAPETSIVTSFTPHGADIVATLMVVVAVA